MRHRDGRCSIEVRDDGPGISTERPRDKTFGTTLIETLGKELRAQLAWKRLPRGTQFEIVFSTEQADVSA
jgi:two-component sensor histidine kinase